MFRREVKSVADVLQQLLREEGLETPLQQKRLIDSWETVTGRIVARYTTEKFIQNQNVVCKNSKSSITPGFGYDAPTAR